MATVLTAIVCVFIICHAPKAALNIYEVSTVYHIFTMKQNDINPKKFLLQELFPFLSWLKREPEVNLIVDIIANISHILIVTNSAVNIIVYALKVCHIDWK